MPGTLPGTGVAYACVRVSEEKHKNDLQSCLLGKEVKTAMQEGLLIRAGIDLETEE